MLLPDNIHPELTIYYSGAIILDLYKNIDSYELEKLFDIVKRKYGMSLSTFVLSLDWLFLIGMIVVDEKGYAKKCI
jgi:hypothetical protein